MVCLPTGARSLRLGGPADTRAPAGRSAAAAAALGRDTGAEGESRLRDGRGRAEGPPAASSSSCCRLDVTGWRLAQRAKRVLRPWLIPHDVVSFVFAALARSSSLACTAAAPGAVASNPPPSLAPSSTRSVGARARRVRARGSGSDVSQPHAPYTIRSRSRRLSSRVKYRWLTSRSVSVAGVYLRHAVSTTALYKQQRSLQNAPAGAQRLDVGNPGLRDAHLPGQLAQLQRHLHLVAERVALVVAG